MYCQYTKVNRPDDSYCNQWKWCVNGDIDFKAINLQQYITNGNFSRSNIEDKYSPEVKMEINVIYNRSLKNLTGVKSSQISIPQLSEYSCNLWCRFIQILLHYLQIHTKRNRAAPIENDFTVFGAVLWLGAGKISKCLTEVFHWYWDAHVVITTSEVNWKNMDE